MKSHLSLFSLLLGFILSCHACSRMPQKTEPASKAVEKHYKLARVGPANIVQVYAQGFDQLTPKEKIFACYLYQASLAGRDIAIDQHHRNALEVRDLLEEIYQHSSGVDPQVNTKITTYLMLFWINNGFYDNLTSKKIVPECSFEEFKTACEIAQKNGAQLTIGGETLDTKLTRLRPVVFDPQYESIMTNKTPGEDFIARSAVNFYERGLTFKEVDAWAKAGKEQSPLNSFVAKEHGRLLEKVWRAGGEGAPSGAYGTDLRAVIKYLEMAVPYAASEFQAETVRKLIRYLRTGKVEDFRQFNIHWVKDDSKVDFIMGFIEVYLDPRGQKGEWEASVFFTDPEQTRLMQNLAKSAQYFEDKAPWKDEYKKKIDQIPIANVIDVAVETGGTGPVSPIGINLPNEQAIRQQYGSKSVLLHNIVEAADKASGKDLVREFACDPKEVEMTEKYGSLADNLHTAMHEVIGHGSGKVSEKLKGKDPADFLPGYYSTLEEARADLVALWNAWDPRLVDAGIAKDQEEARRIGETMYQQQIRVTLTQLRRIGKNDYLSEDHMKNRALIGHYVIENSKGVKVEVRDGKTYYHIVDYEATRQAMGQLLAEIMRIKAEGDLSAAKALVDRYGFKVDPRLRDEVQERVKKLDVAAYNGYVMPKLELIAGADGSPQDVKVSYPLDLASQMLEYSKFTQSEKEKAAKTTDRHSLRQ
jgi:dipeptidyl-peptidase-3